MFPKREKIRSLTEQEQYWRAKMIRDFQPLELYTDFPRPPVQSYIRGRESITLTDYVAERACSGNHPGPEIVFVSVLAMLLNRYTNQERICIGCLSNDRSRSVADAEFFLNPVVLLADLDGCSTFSDVLKAFESIVQEAGENRDFSFESIAAFTDADSIGRAPVFQVLFLTPGQEELAAFSHYAVRCDLVFSLRSIADAMEIVCDYDCDLFEPITIQRLLSHFHNLLQAAMTHPDGEFAKFPILTELEIRQLAEWNETAADYPRDLSIPQVFEIQTENSPDAIALSSDKVTPPPGWGVWPGRRGPASSRRGSGFGSREGERPWSTETRIWCASSATSHSCGRPASSSSTPTRTSRTSRSAARTARPSATRG
jgi:hypothetical protein